MPDLSSGTTARRFAQLRRARPSEALITLAAAAYDFMAEEESPAPDHIMRSRARRNLSDAVNGLSHDERVWLAAVAGR